MCTSFCPSVGGQLSLWCSESSWSGCSYRHHIETFIDSQQRVIMLMIIFLFISLPAETPFPIFLSLSSESPTRNVLLLRWLSSLGYTLVSNHYIWCLGHESEDSMSTLAGRRGMRPKMMMPFDSQPPQRKLKASLFSSAANILSYWGPIVNDLFDFTWS